MIDKAGFTTDVTPFSGGPEEGRVPELVHRCSWRILRHGD